MSNITLNPIVFGLNKTNGHSVDAVRHFYHHKSWRACNELK